MKKLIITSVLILFSGIGFTQVLDNDTFEEFEIYRENDKLGLKDENGSIMLQAKYDAFGDYFVNGLLDVYVNEKLGFVNKEGKEIIPCEYYDFDFEPNGRSFIALKKDEKWGFLDRKGNIKIPFKFDGVGQITYYTRLMPISVKIKDKWGIIDTLGTALSPFKYDFIGGFYEDWIAITKIEDKWGFIAIDGTEITPCKYNKAYSFSNGFTSVRIDNKWSFIDTTGKELVPFKYDFIGSFEEEGIAKANMGGEFIITKDEETAMGGKWGLIDSNGKELTPFKYDSFKDIAPSSTYHFMAMLNGKEIKIDKYGKEVE